MSEIGQTVFSKFSIASFIGATLGVIAWLLWQVVKGISIGLVMLLYEDK